MGSICLLLVLLLSFLALSGFIAEASVGLGVKWLDESPFVVTHLKWGGLGIEAGAWLESTTVSSDSAQLNTNILYYLASGKVYAPLPIPIKPYAGAGILGISASLSASSSLFTSSAWATTTGYDLFGGAELSFADFGLPFTIFAGVNYLYFEDLQFTDGGTSYEYPGSIGEGTYHIGFRLDFG